MQTATLAATQPMSVIKHANLTDPSDDGFDDFAVSDQPVQAESKAVSESDGFDAFE